MNKPCMSFNIEIIELSDGRYTVFNRMSKKTYFIGELEYSVLISLDGTKEIDKLDMNITKLSSTDLEKLIEQFEKIGFLKGTEVKRKNSITRMTMAVINPNKYFKQSDLFVKIFSFVITFCSLPIFALSVWLNRSYFVEYLHLISNTFSFITIIIIILMTIVLLFFHEISHIVVAKKYGVNVPEAGIILYWFMPGAYVNLSCVDFLKSKWQKICIFLAGILFNLLISGLALLGCLVTDKTVRFYLLWLGIDNLFTAIFNLFISLKLDGYLILKELIGEKSLRERSFQHLRTLRLSAFRKIVSTLSKGDLNFYNYRDLKEEKAASESVYLAYGIFALLYIPILLLSIILTWISYIY